ncbi:Carotenoid cleavage dioxygenase 1 [Colletotrichum higginsianum IMI 349063]|uniref:Carotenoid cleavage dioxygenase 1 n=2 Tax=Colletotrichum higginsianum TaxID=80884 RepID=A0A1B7Y7L0_COLHI|nr:Carotenoid cleavage dioxygenase 1 [Colletotrichum higginsianum IMI 349063]OBR07945.1 Carotenoid cleavage dioxygenase 1 [Colletotrichum higginsianum IMI 349063]
MSTTTITTSATPIAMTSEAKIPARTVRRTAQDEAADLQMFKENRLRAPYDEWPNEAGFDGLTEERGPIELTVQGHIPAWAAGALYRTGPGSCKVEDTPKGTYYVSHWFDGFAHTHKFDIVAPSKASSFAHGRTRVLYSSRRQCDELVASVKATGHQNRYTFGQKADPCIGIFGKFMGVFSKGDGPNICVAVSANVPGFDSRESDDDKEKSGQEEDKRSGGEKSDGTPDQSPSGSGHRNRVRSLWLSTDSSPLQEIDPDTLEPVGIATQDRLHPDLSGPMSCAHAQRDPETGDMYNFNLALSMTSTYRVFRTSAATGKTDILAAISGGDAKPAYIHSFFLTKSFVVLCIPSSHLAYRGMAVPWQRNILDAIAPFDAANRCRWYFVDRLHGKGVVASFETPAGFFFHTTNAFEEPSADGPGLVDVFCEISGYQNLNILHNLYYDVLLNRNDATTKFWTENERLNNGYASLQRFKFRLPDPSRDDDAGTSTAAEAAPTEPELLVSIPAPHAGELPTINPDYLTRRHRYVYSLSDRGLSTLLDTIVKTDVDTREALMWECPRAHTPGEPIFVPRPPTAATAADGRATAVAEDDGVILSVVLDGTTQRSYLLCLDAASMTELGRAECDFAVGMGFHGIHAPSGPGMG